MAKLEDLVNDFKGIDQPHSHNFDMIMFVRKGSGTHTIGFKTYEINNNLLYFLTLSQVHNWDLWAETEGFTLVLRLIIFPTLRPPTI